MMVSIRLTETVGVRERLTDCGCYLFVHCWLLLWHWPKVIYRVELIEEKRFIRISDVYGVDAVVGLA